MFEIASQAPTNSLPPWQEMMLAVFEPRQVAILIIVLLAAWVLQIPLRRLLKGLEGRLAQFPWAGNVLFVTGRLMLPLTARLLGQLALEISQIVSYNDNLLALANHLISLWLVYRLLAALFEVNLPPAQAHFWSRRILLPFILFVGGLRILGVLDRVLAWNFLLGQAKITLGSVIWGLALVAIFIGLARGIHRFLRQTFLIQAGAEPALAQAISTLISYLIIGVGAGVALNTMGINLTTLAVIAGGLSVGLGFGLQEIVNNFVSGFILLFERSLAPGDVVRIGDNVGEVQRVGIRSATIKTRDNIELIVPNSYFLTEIVTNLTRGEKLVRMRISVGVSYEASPREVEQALLEAAAGHPRILAQPSPSVQFQDFGDNSLNFDLLVWTDEAQRIPTLTSDLRYNIWDALAARQIEIPFPQRDIHIRSGVPWSDLTQLAKNGD